MLYSYMLVPVTLFVQFHHIALYDTLKFLVENDIVTTGAQQLLQSLRSQDKIS